MTMRKEPYDKWLALKDNPETIYHLYEGTGDNLLAEDRKEGYVDYFNYDIWTFDVEKGIWDTDDGGMILTEKMICDLSDEECIARLDGMVFDWKDNKPAGILTPDTVIEVDPELLEARGIE